LNKLLQAHLRSAHARALVSTYFERKGPLMRRRRMAKRCALLLACAAGLGGQATSASAYNPITPTSAGQTVTLDGKHLTISQVIAVARYGA
jgi:hypothetical protein